MKLDGIDVRTVDRVAGSSVPDGYVHLVLTAIVKQDDVEVLTDAAQDGVQVEVRPLTQASELTVDTYAKIVGERTMLRGRGRL